MAQAVDVVPLPAAQPGGAFVERVRGQGQVTGAPLGVGQRDPVGVGDALLVAQSCERRRLGLSARRGLLLLAAEGPLVVVKLGGHGALAVRADELIHVAAPAGVMPVDTIGAGDSFDAGVLTGLLNGWPPERMLELGCACGALSTRGAGGTAAQPTLEEALA